MNGWMRRATELLHLAHIRAAVNTHARATHEWAIHKLRGARRRFMNFSEKFARERADARAAEDNLAM